MSEPSVVHLFHTDDAGPTPESPTLLLVHGWGGDSQEWCPHLPLLRAWARVIAVDLRGHGWSPRPDDGYESGRLAADVATVLRQRSARNVIAVGHSMGGQVVTTLAVESPDLVSAVVVLDPAYGATGDEIGHIPRRLTALRQRGWPAAWEIVELGFGEESTPVLRIRHERAMSAMTAATLAGCYDGMYTAAGAYGTRPASQEYLRRRRCPTLALHSRVESAEWERPLLSAHSKVVVWPDSGHYLHEERPAELCLLLHTWALELSAIPGSRAGATPGPITTTKVA